MANKGCDPESVPSMNQIEYHVPSSIRTCPHAPKSPGKKASKKKRAKYIAGLYYAWEKCHGNLKKRDYLYKKYRDQLNTYNAGI